MRALAPFAPLCSQLCQDATAGRPTRDDSVRAIEHLLVKNSLQCGLRRCLQPRGLCNFKGLGVAHGQYVLSGSILDSKTEDRTRTWWIQIVQTFLLSDGLSAPEQSCWGRSVSDRIRWAACAECSKGL